MHTHWDCGSRGAVSQWCWAASEHILSPAQDSIWWLVRCNWSVDYYLSCACQIKIIKMKGGSNREWNVSGLLHCGRVVHAFPLPETDRSLYTSQENVMPLRKLNPPPHLPPKQHWVCDRPGHVHLIQTQAEVWVSRSEKVLEDMGVTESWLTTDSAEMSEVGFTEVKQFKDAKKLGNFQTHDNWLCQWSALEFGDVDKTDNINVKRVNKN